MDSDDLDPPTAKVNPFKESLDSMSIEELENRIKDLGSEIERCKAAIDAKKSSAAAAEAFFKG